MKDQLKKTSDHFFRELNLQFLVHELKDPLAVINSNIQMLLDRREKWGPLSPRQEKTLRRTLRNTRKARDMVYTLLEIGQSEAGCYECSDFDPVATCHGVLMDVLEMMCAKIYDQLVVYEDPQETMLYLAKHGVKYEIEPSAREVKMHQDLVRFRHIVGNLLKNAMHFRREQVRIYMHASQGRLIVEIADDGPGIAPEYHDTVFNSFTQVKACDLSPRRGHGIGLAGARLLAHSLKGAIELESQKGEGALFRLILPLVLN